MTTPDLPVNRQSVAPLRILLALLICIAAFTPVYGFGAEFRTFVGADATVIDYAVVLPDGFSQDQTYPTILALPPGPQTRDMVNAGLASYWEDMAKQRGFIVVSPVAPNGQLFFRGSEIHIPSFLDHVAETLPVDGARFHVAGISNGGLSAFRIALAHPERIKSVTVLPGFPPSQAEFANLEALKGIQINMFVGAQDAGWLENSQATVDALLALGERPQFEILPGEGHFLRTIAGPSATRIFDLFPE